MPVVNRSDNRLPSEPPAHIKKASLASFLHYSSLSNYSNPDSGDSSSESATPTPSTPQESQLELGTTNNNSASLSPTRAKNGPADKSSLNPTNEDRTSSIDIGSSAHLNSIMESSSTSQTTETKPDVKPYKSSTLIK